MIVLVHTDSTIHKYKDSKHKKRRLKNQHATKEAMLCFSVQYMTAHNVLICQTD